MHTQSKLSLFFVAVFGFALAGTAWSQSENLARPVAELEKLLAAEPLVIVQTQTSRPLATDVTLRAEVSFGGEAPMRVKLRRAEPGADSFNNVPRYELAAYELQKLFLDPADYVVPPTALRFIPLADYRKVQPTVQQTFGAAEQVLAVVQVWLRDVDGPPDVLDLQRFDADARYARHIGQLNLLTVLMEHADSNRGNFLIGRAEAGARVFSVDNGVAFASEPSDRGELWRELRVKRLPADAVARLRSLSEQQLEQRLSVLAQWRLAGDRYVPEAPGPLIPRRSGVRRSDTQLQMGLTVREIGAVYRQLRGVLKRVDAGEITLVPAP